MRVTSDVDSATQARLLKRMQAGDTAAFDEVYDAYRPRLFGYLLRMCHRRDLAEDLLQETWIRLATKVRGLRDDTNLWAWLLTVARNLYLSHRRWSMLDLSRLEVLFRTPEGSFPTPLDLAEANETERRTEHAIAAMPAKYREAVLIVADGMSPAEAAKVVGISGPAFRKRLSRARAMLKSSLDQENES